MRRQWILVGVAALALSCSENKNNGETAPAKILPMGGRFVEKGSVADKSEMHTYGCQTGTSINIDPQYDERIKAGDVIVERSQGFNMRTGEQRHLKLSRKYLAVRKTSYDAIFSVLESSSPPFPQGFEASISCNLKVERSGNSTRISSDCQTTPQLAKGPFKFEYCYVNGNHTSSSEKKLSKGDYFFSNGSSVLAFQQTIETAGEVFCYTLDDTAENEIPKEKSLGQGVQKQSYIISNQIPSKSTVHCGGEHIFSRTEVALKDGFPQNVVLNVLTLCLEGVI